MPSSIAWERVLDRLRMRLPGSPSRSVVFGRAGLRHSKMLWMRRYPNLRADVIVKLSRALRIRPGRMLDMIVSESWTDPLGEIHFEIPNHTKGGQHAGTKR
jgi:hypothetical protein